MCIRGRITNFTGGSLEWWLGLRESVESEEYEYRRIHGRGKADWFWVDFGTE